MKGSNLGVFSFDTYDDAGKKVIGRVVCALREQWEINGCVSQYWFYASQVSDASLSESIILKWLRVLKDMGALYFFKPVCDLETLNSVIISPAPLDVNHDWGKDMKVALLINGAPDGRPGIAIDIDGMVFEALEKGLLRKNITGKFSKDNLERFYYGDNLLEEVNNSKHRKAVLIALLTSERYTVSAAEIDSILGSDGTNERRNKVVSELRRALRKITHEIDIVSHKKGHAVDTYELVQK